jgi:4-alpha-glucanotransferase
LAGPFGAGDLGSAAHRFVDFLAEAGQKLWQILPLGPPGPGNSPYAARSTFAANPLVISLEQLVAEGLIDADALAAPPAFPAARVDFDAVAEWRAPLLRQAFARFRDAGRMDELQPFYQRTAAWLGDYALFEALTQRHGEGWTEWPKPLARRERDALLAARDELSGEWRYQVFLQWLFARQWEALRHHTRRLGIRIIGDIPIFPAHDSAEVWAHQELFKLDGSGRPTVVAGVPPDYFSETGQRWGNPLYRWDEIGRHGYRWWIERFRATLAQVDVARLDHFRGFEAAWEIPVVDETAANGEWVPGPGLALFDAVRAAIGPLPLIAEDLGSITPGVRRLLDATGLPGMKVLQFAFDTGPTSPYLPHNHVPRNVVYTGTHDNDTTEGWWASLGDEVRATVIRYAGCDAGDGTGTLMRMAYASVAEMAIVPMQDVLRLGSEARMNRPAQPDGNWDWRFTYDQVPDGAARDLRDLAETYGRA